MKRESARAPVNRADSIVVSSQVDQPLPGHGCVFRHG